MSDEDPRIYELQSVFCPNGDDHPVRGEVVVPPRNHPSPDDLIDYSIRCVKCQRRWLVHAEKRWRIKGDYKTLYKSKEAALTAATGGQDE